MSTDGQDWSSPRGAAPGAFGLEIDAAVAIPGLDAPGAVAGGRSTGHSPVEREELEARVAEGELAWIGSDGEGAARVSYWHHSSGGVLIRTETRGDHLIAARGRTVLSAVAGIGTRRWQGYVLGQVLPLAASIQGLEVFHASAVAVDGGIVILAGPSHSGKSTLACALVGSGAARFYADDVLALDLTPFELRAYPGTNLMGIPRGPLAELARDVVLGPPSFADQRRVLAPVRGERRSLPVRAFFRLTPDRHATGFRFGPCLPDRLMATTFDGISRGDERPLRLLRVGAMLAADGRAQELRYRPGLDPREVAAALLERLGSEARAWSHAS